VRLPNDFTPRPYQRRYMAHFDNGGKRAIWVVHRRGGKDLTAMHQTVKEDAPSSGSLLARLPDLLSGPQSDLGRLHQRRQADHRSGVPARAGEAEERARDVRRAALRISLAAVGLDKIEVVGAGPVGVVFSEYAVAKPKAADLISPMLMENNGWESYITTPRGRNHAFKLYNAAKDDPRWFCEVQTLYDTRAYEPEATLAAERARGRPEALIRQEYLCDWTAANVGSVWGDLVESLERSEAISAFEHGGNEVFTSWDLGHTDATAIWFWRLHGGSVEVIDHYEAHGKPMSHYFDVVDAKPYSYLKHWLPHDARAKTLQTGSSILEQSLQHWPKQGRGGSQPLPRGRHSGWALATAAGIRIHSRCEAGIEALRQYHYEYDEDTKAFGLKPEHDWSSHTADAFRYLAVIAKYAGVISRKEAPKAPPKVPPLSEAITVDRLFEKEEVLARRKRI
jgi:phage terminase large subunit